MKNPARITIVFDAFRMLPGELIARAENVFYFCKIYSFVRDPATTMVYVRDNRRIVRRIVFGTRVSLGARTVDVRQHLHLLTVFFCGFEYDTQVYVYFETVSNGVFCGRSARKCNGA